MNKKWVTTAVVLVAFALVAGTWLMDRARTAKDARSAAGSTTASTPLPQTKNVDLKKVTTPPAQTVAYVDSSKYSSRARYSITFVPYGTGPVRQTLVIQVKTSKASVPGTSAFDFAGKNVLVSTAGLAPSASVRKGGVYSGRLALTDQGGVLLPTLLEVTRAK